MSSRDLRVDLGRGLVLPNPVGVASGTFGYGFEFEELVDIQRLGAIWTKGTTLRPRAGNPPPRVAETTAGMLNSIGLHNPGVEHVATVYAPRFAGWRVPVVVNVAGGSLEEYVAVVRRLDGVPGIGGIELNISCPNIAHGLDFGRDPAAAARVVEAVRAVTGLCLVVKLSPNVTAIAAVARAVEAAGADAVSAVNTYVGMKVHLGVRRPVLPGPARAGSAARRSSRSRSPRSPRCAPPSAFPCRHRRDRHRRRRARVLRRRRRRRAGRHRELRRLRRRARRPRRLYRVRRAPPPRPADRAALDPALRTGGVALDARLGRMRRTKGRGKAVSDEGADGLGRPPTGGRVSVQRTGIRCRCARRSRSF